MHTADKSRKLKLISVVFLYSHATMLSNTIIWEGKQKKLKTDAGISCIQ